mmetsp:Transcript_21198/g.49758  ORF Transcript_21198/g.49758 Transcript_21198/m.49758 type:complete len:216 (-) Transcript_21198:12-659(-)
MGTPPGNDLWLFNPTAASQLTVGQDGNQNRFGASAAQEPDCPITVDHVEDHRDNLGFKFPESWEDHGVERIGAVVHGKHLILDVAQLTDFLVVDASPLLSVGEAFLAPLLLHRPRQDLRLAQGGRRNHCLCVPVAVTKKILFNPIKRFLQFAFHHSGHAGQHLDARNNHTDDLLVHLLRPKLNRPSCNQKSGQTAHQVFCLTQPRVLRPVSQSRN